MISPVKPVGEERMGVRLELSPQCFQCGRKFEFNVNADDYWRWGNGELIQSAMPYLSESERELLISKTCGECFDELCEETEEADAY